MVLGKRKTIFGRVVGHPEVGLDQEREIGFRVSQLPDSSSSDHDRGMESFAQLGGPVENDGHGLGLQLLHGRVDQKSLIVPGHVINSTGQRPATRLTIPLLAIRGRAGSITLSKELSDAVHRRS